MNWIHFSLRCGDHHVKRWRRVLRCATGRAAARALVANGVRQVSPYGVLDDPTGATSAEGAELFAQMVDAACREL
jgi:creatinine amidohydrolase/Fe(II)-dependent formamide hydrolase-like protein